jgi:hypothetical protein
MDVEDNELNVLQGSLNTLINSNYPKILFESNSFNEKVISYENEQIPFDYPTYYPIDKNIFISPSIQKRFENTYKEPFNVPFENALMGTLNTFFSDEKFTVVGSPQLDKKLKQKYYSNPIYQTLSFNFTYSITQKELTELDKKMPGIKDYVQYDLNNIPASSDEANPFVS